MNLYHYSTWKGLSIIKDRKVKPSSMYWYGSGILDRHAEPLSFFTTDPFWEPSVQAATKRKQWEKCGSCPRLYAALGIPCWRFRVDTEGMYSICDAVRTVGDRWDQMLLDADDLGSDTSKWWVTPNPKRILEAWKWSNDYENWKHWGIFI